MREIDTAVLRLVDKALGIGRAITPTRPSVFDDDNLQQVLDVGTLVRRGGTQRPDTEGGIYRFTERHVHAGAGALSSFVQPYDVGSGSALADPGWPGVSRDEDVWLFGCSLIDRTGTAALTNAALSVSPNGWPGFSSNDSGGAITPDTRVSFLVWDGTLVGTQYMANGDSFGRLGFRYPRGVPDIRFTSTAGAAGEVDFNVIIGVFPIGLGQDLAV